MEVKIISIFNIGVQNTGIIHEVKSSTDNPKGIEVQLKDGDQGNVISVEMSDEVRIERIMATESDSSDNKLNFYEPVMSTKEIPQTVSSFTNADGGYVYIGILDDAKTLEEKLVGLKSEKEIIEEKEIKRKKLQPGEKFTDQKFQDKYRGDIEDKLEAHLSSTVRLGSLYEFEFPTLHGVTVLEILVKKSSAPVFYSDPPRNKHSGFQVSLSGKNYPTRELDEFHYRNGSHKNHCDTFEEFLRYYEQNF